MAIINVDDAYVLNETGAQVDKVTGLFTKDENTDAGEKAFAQLNIGTAGSNRNYLDNPWFTVNQRGFSSGQTGQLLPWVDRWLMNSDPSNPATLTLSDGVVTITAPSGGFCNILQTLADPSSIVGKTVTLSALKSDGTIISGTITRIANTTQDAYSVGGITLRLSSSNRFAVQADDGASISIKAAKLEFGSVSTLANDVPPKESQATNDCKWYFQRIQQEDGYTAPVGFGMVATSTNILRALIPLSSPLRKAGTLTATATNIGQMRVQGNGINLTPTAITGRGVLNGNAVVDITVNGTLTNNQVYNLLFANSTAIIDLSKEL